MRGSCPGREARAAYGGESVVSIAREAYDTRARAPCQKFPGKCARAVCKGEVMRKRWVKWFAGTVAFALPAMISVIGARLDRSSIAHAPAYKSSIPVVLGITVLLAAVLPGTLIMTSTGSLSRRIGLTAAMLCLLALECGLAGYIVLMEGLR